MHMKATVNSNLCKRSSTNQGIAREHKVVVVVGVDTTWVDGFQPWKFRLGAHLILSRWIVLSQRKIRVIHSLTWTCYIVCFIKGKGKPSPSSRKREMPLPSFLLQPLECRIHAQLSISNIEMVENQQMKKRHNPKAKSGVYSQACIQDTTTKSFLHPELHEPS